MDDTTKAIINRITVRYDKPTEIPSGDKCTVFYDCFQLNPNDLARLAAQAVGHVDHDQYDMALGIAYSGILFAAAVAGGREVSILQKDGKLFGPSLKGKKIVIVDDVVHRGRHMAEAAVYAEKAGATVVAYVCMVDRSNGTVGTKERPLWSAFQADME